MLLLLLQTTPWHRETGFFGPDTELWLNWYTECWKKIREKNVPANVITIFFFQADEDQKNQIRMQELVAKLQAKLKQYKKMAEDAVRF